MAAWKWPSTTTQQRIRALARLQLERILPYTELTALLLAVNFVARVAPEVLLHPAVEAAFDGSDPVSDLCYAGITRHPDPIFQEFSTFQPFYHFLLDFGGCWHMYMASILCKNKLQTIPIFSRTLTLTKQCFHGSRHLRDLACCSFLLPGVANRHNISPLGRFNFGRSHLKP